MDPASLLTQYDTHLRAGAEVADVDHVVNLGPLLLATLPARHRGFVTYAPFAMPAEELGELIDTVVAHYAADAGVDHFEWKTRGHDPLPGLPDLLRSRGFVMGEQETVMAGVVDAVIAADPGVPEGYLLERCNTEEGLRQAEDLAGRVFGDSADRRRRQSDELVARFRSAPESFEMWAVRNQHGEVVCSGRVDFVDGADFAGLWGGACAPEHRGLGLYRTVVAARARSAREHGKQFLQVDCSQYSRPILQRAGLVPITTTTPATWYRG